jgi:hypothetical protein
VIPSNDYNNFTNLVNTNANPQYASWAFVIYKRSYSESTKGPLLGNIAWHQGDGFNNLIPGQPSAGCVNIALGQIMYYHQYPGSYNWSAMLPGSGNAASQALIRNLYFATGGDGSADINYAKSALSTFGYSYTQQDHNSTTSNYVRQSLNNNRPVYMRGVSGNANTGHAWVCDGYKTTSPKIEFILAFVPNGPIQYDIHGPYSSITTTYYYNHNWGWGGGSQTPNGWFIGEDIQTNLVGGGTYNPTSNRKDLINIHPN